MEFFFENDLAQYILTQDSPVFFAIVVIFLGVNLLAPVEWFYALKNKRLAEDTPITKSIAAAAQGYIAIWGRAGLATHGTVYSYLTNKECVWYRYKIEELLGDNRNRRYVTIKDFSSHLPFSLYDESGMCFVEPKPADQIQAKRKELWYSDDKYTVRVQNRVKKDPWGNKKYRYTEEWIEDGDFVFVMGDFRTMKKTNIFDSESAMVRRIMVDWKRNKTFMLENFDKNKDGQVDMREWEDARDKALTIVRNKPKSFLVTEDVDILTKPVNTTHPFIISGVGKKHFIKHSARVSNVSLLITIVCLPILVWILMVRFVW